MLTRDRDVDRPTFNTQNYLSDFNPPSTLILCKWIHIDRRYQPYSPLGESLSTVDIDRVDKSQSQTFSSALCAQCSRSADVPLLKFKKLVPNFFSSNNWTSCTSSGQSSSASSSAWPWDPEIYAGTYKMFSVEYFRPIKVLQIYVYIVYWIEVK